LNNCQKSIETIFTPGILIFCIELNFYFLGDFLMSDDIPPSAPDILSPTSDAVFKRLFGQPERKQNLIHFANAVLFEGKPVIQDVTYLNTELSPVRRDGKGCRVDVKATMSTGQFLNLEIQLDHERPYPRRALLYASMMYVEQFEKGEKYRKLRDVWAIHVVNFRLFPKKKGFHSSYRMRSDISPHESLTDALALHFVELPKMKNSESCDTLSLWTMFLKGESMEDFEQVAQKSPAIANALSDLLMISHDPQAREEYIARRKYEMDQESLRWWAKRSGRKEGRAEGRVKGLTEGRVKGLAEGRVEGRVEGEAIGLFKGLEYSLPKKFPNIPSEFWEYLRRADTELLKSAFENMFTSNSFEEFSKKLHFSQTSQQNT
jgi:predicted transposase/invertase (TIGR01784 family)